MFVLPAGPAQVRQRPVDRSRERFPPGTLPGGMAFRLTQGTPRCCHDPAERREPRPSRWTQDRSARGDGPRRRRVGRPDGLAACAARPSARARLPTCGSTRRRSRPDPRPRRRASHGSPWSGRRGPRTCTRTVPGPQDPPHVAEDLDRVQEVVDRHAADHRIERAVVEGQDGVGVEVVHDRGGGGGVGGQLGLVHPQHGEACRRHSEVGHPGPHEIQDVSADAERFVELADRGDGGVVDVRDEPGHRVEAASARRRRGRRSRRGRDPCPSPARLGAAPVTRRRRGSALSRQLPLGQGQRLFSVTVNECLPSRDPGHSRRLLRRFGPGSASRSRT